MVEQSLFLSHVSPFFRSHQIPQCTVLGRQLLFYPSRGITWTFFLRFGPLHTHTHIYIYIYMMVAWICVQSWLEGEVIVHFLPVQYSRQDKNQDFQCWFSRKVCFLHLVEKGNTISLFPWEYVPDSTKLSKSLFI